DEAAEALRFNRRLLGAALEAVPQGICTFDSELRITAWNGRFLRLLDLPDDAVRVGLPLAELAARNRARGRHGGDDPAFLM
ncbi:PAS-domain containing protein, partial [Acinetobacter nosocomialis]|uniref:PAS-domain containing protein n=1 Tax=Acinetobacter nosocomialis TaxID=106654 RepID=UPI0013D69D48